MSDPVVTKGKVSAADRAQFVCDAMDGHRFYIFSHPNALVSVQVRLEAVMTPRHPTDPFEHRPEQGERLRADLRSGRLTPGYEYAARDPAYEGCASWTLALKERDCSVHSHDDSIRHASVCRVIDSAVTLIPHPTGACP